MDEADVISAFHSLQRSSLLQAVAEGLLTESDVAAGDANIQLAAPALSLYFAALGAQGNPPAISAPDGRWQLSALNCPSSFTSFFDLWASTVEPIKNLPSSERYSLALMLCDKEPVSSPIRMDVTRIATALKGIALEITQRRTFQQLFTRDLQHTLDSNIRRSSESERQQRTQYQPPPEYEGGIPDVQTDEKQLGAEGLRSYRPASSPSPRPPALPPRPTSSPNFATAPAPELLENLTVIRETLYSALAEALLTTPSVRGLLARGPSWASRAYFASTCLAILEVALSRVEQDGVRVVQMGGSSPILIRAQDTPPYLRHFLGRLVEISQQARAMQEEDDERAILEASDGDVTSTPRLESLRARLEHGAGVDGAPGTDGGQVDQAVAILSNAINELALEMSRLPAFSSRQQEVFPVLMSVTS